MPPPSPYICKYQLQIELEHDVGTQGEKNTDVSLTGNEQIVMKVMIIIPNIHYRQYFNNTIVLILIITHYACTRY